jgi:hypothetical protein
MKIDLDSVKDLLERLVHWAAIGFSLSVGHWLWLCFYKYVLAKYL